MDQLSRLNGSKVKQWLEEHHVPPDVVEQFQGKVYVMIVVIIQGRSRRKQFLIGSVLYYPRKQLLYM